MKSAQPTIGMAMLRLKVQVHAVEEEDFRTHLMFFANFSVVALVVVLAVAFLKNFLVVLAAVVTVVLREVQTYAMIWRFL